MLMNSVRLKPNSITLSGSNQLRTSFEPASLMEFGFYRAEVYSRRVTWRRCDQWSSSPGKVYTRPASDRSCRILSCTLKTTPKSVLYFVITFTAFTEHIALLTGHMHYQLDLVYSSSCRKLMTIQ